MAPYNIPQFFKAWDNTAHYAKKRKRAAYPIKLRGYSYARKQMRSGGVQLLEIKARSGTATFGDILIPARIVHIGGLAIGTDIDERIGRTVVIKKLFVNMQLIPAVGSLTASYRILLLYDRQPNGTLATEDAIFDGVGPHNALSFKEMDSRDRFKTLYNSGLITLNGNAAADSIWNQEIALELNLPQTFSGTSSTIGSITTGALLMVAIGKNAGAGQGHDLITENRIRFVDGGNRKERVYKQRTKSTQFKRS